MPVDIYQSTVDTLTDVTNRPQCYGVFGPLFQLFGSCANPAPSESIAPLPPILPAAPRSVAEISSGLWTPEDAYTIGIQDWLAKRKQQQDIDKAASGNIATVGPPPPDGPPKPTDYTLTELLLFGALGIIGVGAVIKVLR